MFLFISFMLNLSLHWIKNVSIRILGIEINLYWLKRFLFSQIVIISDGYALDKECFYAYLLCVICLCTGKRMFQFIFFASKLIRIGWRDFYSHRSLLFQILILLAVSNLNWIHCVSFQNGYFKGKGAAF